MPADPYQDLSHKVGPISRAVPSVTTGPYRFLAELPRLPIETTCRHRKVQQVKNRISRGQRLVQEDAYRTTLKQTSATDPPYIVVEKFGIPPGQQQQCTGVFAGHQLQICRIHMGKKRKEPDDRLM